MGRATTRIKYGHWRAPQELSEQCQSSMVARPSAGCDRKGQLAPDRRRRITSMLRNRFDARRHSEQCRCIGDVRSRTWWHRAHSRSATCNHSRDRVGWGSEISVEAVPSEFSTRPAPARRSQLLIGCDRLTRSSVGVRQAARACSSRPSTVTGHLVRRLLDELWFPGRLSTEGAEHRPP